MDKKDYYDVLGVPKGANKDEIKAAYRKLALQFHPDRNKAPEATERFKEISEAYAILSDDEKRHEYDQFGRAGIYERYNAEDIFRGADFDSIFRDIGGFGGIFEQLFRGFGGFGFQTFSEPQRPSRGQDLVYETEISFEEAANGAAKEIEFQRLAQCNICNGTGAQPGSQRKTCKTCNGRGQVQQIRRSGFAQMIQITTCPRCHGEGTVVEKPCRNCGGSGLMRDKTKVQVKIPPGADEGQSLRLRGEGNMVQGGRPGDLFVRVHLKPHQFFKREGDNILYNARVSYPKAAMGGELEVPAIDGKARVKIPPGTRAGTVFRLEGKGFPHVEGWGRGDELVRVDLDVPRDLNKRERELLSELARLRGENLD